MPKVGQALNPMKGLQSIPVPWRRPEPVQVPWWVIPAVNVLSSRTKFLGAEGPWRIAGTASKKGTQLQVFDALAAGNAATTCSFELLYSPGTGNDNTEDYFVLASLVKENVQSLLQVPFDVQTVPGMRPIVSVDEEKFIQKYASPESRDLVTAVLRNFATVIACQESLGPKQMNLDKLVLAWGPTFYDENKLIQSMGHAPQMLLQAPQALSGKIAEAIRGLQLFKDLQPSEGFSCPISDTKPSPCQDDVSSSGKM